MKPRKVLLTLEVETDIPLKELRRKAAYDLKVEFTRKKKSQLFGDMKAVDVQQAQANVVR